MRWAAPAAAIVMVVGACTDPTDDRSAGSASPAAGASEARQVETTCPTAGAPLDGEARLYIEHNATDEDTGIHGSFAHEGLTEACIRAPDGTEIMLVRPGGRFGDLGIDELLFESREPPAEEYAVEDLQADFPEGEYQVSGVDHEGGARVGVALLTHDIPAPPTITEPRLADEESAASSIVPTTGFVVRWEPATETLGGSDLTVTGYEVVVTQVEHADPHGLSRPEYDVHLPPDRTELAVPGGFLEPDTVYELEVLVLEESGNQTISLGFFTAGP